MQRPNANGSGSGGNNMAALQMARDVAATPQHETDISVLRQLVTASKDAEGLLACFFELHFITAAPFQLIWEKFAAAITTAQRRLRRHDQASTLGAVDREFQRGGS